MASQLNPSPRNFQQHGLWRHRTEGEIFWVIKNGSVGTSMVGFGGQLADEEIWSLIQYLRSFSGEHGPGMMGHGEGMGPMMRPGVGMGGMAHGGPRGGMGGMDTADREEGWAVVKVQAAPRSLSESCQSTAANDP